MQSITFVGSVHDLLASLLVFLLGLALVLAIGRAFRISPRLTIVLYLWHTFFCFAYIYFLATAGGDAISYYVWSLNGESSFGVGTDSVVYLCSFFSAKLGLSFLGVSLVFNFVGAIGLLAFYASLRAATIGKGRYVRRLALLFVFLPSISFWSSGIGKDAIAFLATALVLWASVDFRHRLKIVMPAIVVMLLVRPHMAGLLLVALSVSFVAHAKATTLQRISYGAVVVAVTATVIPFVLNYAGIGHLGVGELSDFVDQRQGYNQEGGGGVDIASMSTPMQLFTYLLRPLPFEAGSAAQFASSIDNMVLILFFMATACASIKGRKSEVRADRLFLWVYVLLSWVILAKLTANLGIAVRQKWMFTPMLIFLCLSLIGRRLQVKSATSSCGSKEMIGTTGSL